MGFAGAGVPDQTQWVSGLDPGAGGQLPDDGGVGVKRELLQPFWSWKGRVADAAFGAAAASVVAFSDHQLRQKPQIGQLLALGGRGDLGESVTDGRQAQHATALLDRCAGGLLGDTAPAGHEVSRPSSVSYLSTEGSGRSSAGTAAVRCSASTTTRPPGWAWSGPVAAASRRSAALRASTATTSGLVDPTDSAALMPASTSARSRWRCNSSTSTSARVPAASPWALRAAVQNVSCSAVKAFDARACASAVAPGRAPGLRCRISR